jgi:hypothetical protein
MDTNNEHKIRAEQAQRVRLQMKISDMILDLVRDAIDGKLDDEPNGDVQGICEALAIQIIAKVKEEDGSREIKAGLGDHGV